MDSNGRLKESAARGSGPWRSKAPTMVGSGKVVMRFMTEPEDKERPEANGRIWSIRVFECFEEARMAGWDDEWWGRDVGSFIQTHEDLELVSNLFGNMFSVFNYMPFFCSLMSTWGEYHGGGGHGSAPAHVCDDGSGVSEGDCWV